MTNSVLKAQIDSQITNEATENGITPAEVGGNLKAIIDYIDSKINYSSSAFRVEQNGTNAPVITEYTNSLGTITWVRESAGRIVGTLSSGTFVTAKTFISQSRRSIFSNTSSGTRNLNIIAGGNEIIITQDDGTNPIDGVDVKFEIRVYN